MGEQAAWDETRRRVLRDSLGIGVATGAYGLSFGAIAVAGGFSIPRDVRALAAHVHGRVAVRAREHGEQRVGARFAATATAIMLGIAQRVVRAAA